MYNEMAYGIPNSKISEMGHGIPTSYCQEAKVLFDKMNSVGSSLTEVRKIQIDNVIRNLKSENIWQELDCLFIWAAHSRGAALIDWKNPNSRTATVINQYSGDFLIDNYFKGNGGTFRIDTQFNPSNGNYNFTQFNNSFGHYTVTHIDELRSDVNAFDVNSIGCEMLSVNSSFAINSTNNNSGTGTSVANTTNVGLSSSRRISNKVWQAYKNGYQLYGSNPTPSSIPLPLRNVNFTIFCRLVGSVASVASTKKHAYFFAGSGNFDHFTLHNIIDEYYLTPLAITPTKRIIFNGNSMTDTGSYVGRVIVDLGSFFFDINKRGINGKTTVQLTADAINTVFNKKKLFLIKDVCFFFELTNDMASNSSNATICYNNLVTYCKAFRASLPTTKLVVATMLPRNISTCINANRQNDSNLLDDTTLNGKIRNHLVADGYADYIADVASDPTMGIYSNGVAGVGEKNLTYYNSDEIHPTSAGYILLADTYIYPAINLFL